MRALSRRNKKNMQEEKKGKIKEGKGGMRSSLNLIILN